MTADNKEYERFLSAILGTVKQLERYGWKFDYDIADWHGFDWWRICGELGGYDLTIIRNDITGEVGWIVENKAVNIDTASRFYRTYDEVVEDIKADIDAQIAVLQNKRALFGVGTED